MNQVVDKHTKRELLFLGTLFHDIAKSDVIVKNGDYTSCPKHEEIGSEKVKSILDRFDLSDREKAIVANIVLLIIINGRLRAVSMGRYAFILALN